MLNGFKKFILRGNVVDMAVGVVIGAAFGGVVTALTKDLSDAADRRARRQAGLFVSWIHHPRHAVSGRRFHQRRISFLLIAAAVYFFVVTPINALVARMNRGEKPPDPTTKKCPECLSEIPHRRAPVRALHPARDGQGGVVLLSAPPARSLGCRVGLDPLDIAV